jgi:hypothetical protein
MLIKERSYPIGVVTGKAEIGLAHSPSQGSALITLDDPLHRRSFKVHEGFHYLSPFLPAISSGGCLCWGCYSPALVSPVYIGALNRNLSAISGSLSWGKKSSELTTIITQFGGCIIRFLANLSK